MGSRMDSLARDLADDEVISPELVLVDPELAQIARHRLPDVPEWRPQRLPPPASAPPTLPVRRRVASTYPKIGVGALVAATTLLLLVPLVVPSMEGALLRHPAAPVPPRKPAAPPARDTGSWVPTRFEVEARTLTLLQTANASSAPPGVVDKRSGLLANNTHIACSRVGRTSVFECKLGVGLAGGRTWLLTVAVTRDGAEKITWNGRVAER